MEKLDRWAALGGPLVILFLVCACSFFSPAPTPTSQAGDEGFTFTAPSGYKTREFSGYTDQGIGAESLIFSQKKPIYFQVFRREAPDGENIDALFDAYISKTEPDGYGYRFLSRREIEFSGRPAFEFIFVHFHGEPYVRTREIWFEDGNFIYILSCNQTISTDVAEQLVSAECDRLQEGFQIK